MFDTPSQFLRHGPPRRVSAAKLPPVKLIPKELLRAHEDGEAVIFCGAGVSRSVGLPDFKGLVRKVLTDLLPAQNDCPEGETAALAWAAFDRNEYDDALGLLESPKLGTFDPKRVRQKIRSYLSPEDEESAAHRALIRLSDLDRGKGLAGHHEPRPPLRDSARVSSERPSGRAATGSVCRSRATSCQA